MTDNIHSIDESRLDIYLQAHIEGFTGPLTADKFSGGQSNSTYKISARSGTYVLRKQPPGIFPKSAHAVDREHRVEEALKDSKMPLPQMHHLCEDSDILGAMSYIMEFKNDRTFWDSP